MLAHVGGDDNVRAQLQEYAGIHRVRTENQGSLPTPAARGDDRARGSRHYRSNNSSGQQPTEAYWMADTGTTYSMTDPPRSAGRGYERAWRQEWTPQEWAAWNVGWWNRRSSDDSWQGSSGSWGGQWRGNKGGRGKR